MIVYKRLSMSVASGAIVKALMRQCSHGEGAVNEAKRETSSSFPCPRRHTQKDVDEKKSVLRTHQPPTYRYSILPITCYRYRPAP